MSVDKRNYLKGPPSSSNYNMTHPSVFRVSYLKGKTGDPIGGNRTLKIFTEYLDKYVLNIHFTNKMINQNKNNIIYSESQQYLRGVL